MTGKKQRIHILFLIATRETVREREKERERESLGENRDNSRARTQYKATGHDRESERGPVRK